MGVTLHPRTMKVNRAEIELEEFLLTWAEQHDLTWWNWRALSSSWPRGVSPTYCAPNATRTIPTRRLTRLEPSAASKGVERQNDWYCICACSQKLRAMRS